MIKKIILPLLVVAALSLTACGDKGFTGTKTGEIAGDKGTTVAEVTFEDGKATDVQIDVKNPDGTMKSADSISGAYDMKNAGGKWHEQIDLLEEFLKSNDFDTKKVTLTNEAGNTDAVTGVSIKVKDYVAAVDAALEAAK
ncbi:MAG: hypothetical protein RR620_02965 [Clostridium sp.]